LWFFFVVVFIHCFFYPKDPNLETKDRSTFNPWLQKD